jgi:hypothetical protein
MAKPILPSYLGHFNRFSKKNEKKIVRGSFTKSKKPNFLAKNGDFSHEIEIKIKNPAV